MAKQTRSNCLSGGTDSINNSLPALYFGPIIGGDFNSQLGRDAEQRGTCGAHSLTTPTSGTGQRGMRCSFYAPSVSSALRSSHELRSLRKQRRRVRAKVAEKIRLLKRTFADTQPFFYFPDIMKPCPNVDRDSLRRNLKRMGVLSKPTSIADRLHSRTK